MRSSFLRFPPKGVLTANELLDASPRRRGEWCLDALVGRYVEITGGASSSALTVARDMVLQAQQQGGLVAWVGSRSAMFFPPDFASAGIDLKALLVVFVDDANSASRVVDLLFRSSGFAVIVLDVENNRGFSLAVQTRFAGLAKEYHTVLMEITRMHRDRSSRSSLASLRMETTREHVDGEFFRMEMHALKDKRFSPGWKHTESCYGPDGVC